MEEQHREILLGFILLILIVNTISIFSMASGTVLQTPSSIPVKVAATAAPVPSVTATPPPVASATPPPAKTVVPTPTPVPAREGYINIFSMQDKDLDTSLAPISFDLVKPPLIIDFSVIPHNITDLKYFEYKTLDTEHHESVTITRPYENAAFTINVTNIDTGKVVVDQGVGKEYGLQSPQTLEVMERGNYTIRVAGQFINFSLSMEVPKDRNIPDTPPSNPVPDVVTTAPVPLVTAIPPPVVSGNTAAAIYQHETSL